MDMENFGQKNRLVGSGIYTIPEAARLLKAPTQKVSRWIAPPESDTRPGIIVPELGLIDGSPYLSFEDLIEIHVINQLRDKGVSLQSIRMAHRLMGSILKTEHPFCDERLLTDGRRIYLRIRSKVGDVVEVLSGQMGSGTILHSFLKGVEFQGQRARRWWPLGLKRFVVIDPEISFGKPIISGDGIPTRTLMNAYKANNRNLQLVSRMFKVERPRIRDAVRFEESLAA